MAVPAALSLSIQKDTKSLMDAEGCSAVWLRALDPSTGPHRPTSGQLKLDLSRSRIGANWPTLENGYGPISERVQD